MMQRLFDLAVQIWRIFQLVLELLPGTRSRRWFTVNRLCLFRAFNFRFDSLFNFFRALGFEFRAYIKYRFICHLLSPFRLLSFPAFPVLPRSFELNSAPLAPLP